MQLWRHLSYFPNSMDSLLSPLEQRWKKVKHVSTSALYLAQRTKTQGSPQDFWTMEGTSKGPNRRHRNRCHRHRDHTANCFFNDSAKRDSNATAISGAPTPPQSLPAPDAPQSEPFRRSATGRLGHSSFPENRTEPHLGVLGVASSNLRMHRSAQPSPSALIPDFHTHQHAH